MTFDPITSGALAFLAVLILMALNIPIGILHSSMGGSPLESWISEDKFRSMGRFIDTLDALNNGDIDILSKNWFNKWEDVGAPRKEREWNKLTLSDLKINYPNYMK